MSYKERLSRVTVWREYLQSMSRMVWEFSRFYLHRFCCTKFECVLIELRELLGPGQSLASAFAWVPVETLMAAFDETSPKNNDHTTGTSRHAPTYLIPMQSKGGKAADLLPIHKAAELLEDLDNEIVLEVKLHDTALSLIVT